MKYLISFIVLISIFSCGRDNGINTFEECCELKIEINSRHDVGHVEISPDGYIHERGTKITLEAFPDSNIAFYEWDGDISSIQNPYTFTIDKNVSIIAKFGIDQHWISTSTVGNGTITKQILNTDLEQPDESDSYRHGTILELTAIPNDGWEFKGWQIYHHYDSELFVKEDNPLEYVIRTRENILANFELSQNQGRFEIFKRKAGLNDYAESIIESSDGGYIVTGMVGKGMSYGGIFSEGHIDYGSGFVAKHNSDGTREWVEFIGDEETDFIGKSIIESSNGDIVLTGNLSGYPKVDIMMLSPSGTTRWLKSYGATEGDYGTDIIEADGGFVLTGSSSSIHPESKTGANYILIMKTDKVGNLKWVNTYGGSNTEVGKSIIQAGGEGYLVGGYSNSNDGELTGLNKGNNDIVILKYSLDGDLVWDKTIGGSADDVLLSMVETSDESYVITGFTESSDGDFNGMNKGGQDIFVIKLDSNGNTLWKRTLGGSLDERGTSITVTLEGSIVLTGYSESIDGDFENLNRNAEDIVLIELEANGSAKSFTTFGGSASDYGKSIIALSNGNYVLAGHAYSNNGDFMTDDIVGTALDYFILQWKN